MLKIQHREQSLLSKIGDWLMLPLMYLLQGTLREIPQRTHRWNNTKHKAADMTFLRGEMMVNESADMDAKQRWIGPLPLFHMPIIGGWNEFVVLEPIVKQDIWFVGWVAGDAIGISQIQLQDKVRVLRGQSTVQFFGINEHGEQIHLQKVGDGIVGNSKQFGSIPLL